jgi:o-succinylbenzoate---CoA ligase
MEPATFIKMNHTKYTSLILNGIVYHKDDLQLFCEQKLMAKSLPGWEKNLYRFILTWISPASFIDAKTSGSTGTPKRIRIEKDKMIRSALMTGQYFNLAKNQRALLCLPVNFIAGKMMVIRSFVMGLNLIPVEPSGNPLDEFNDEIDFAAITPHQAGNIFAKENGTEKLNRIRKLIIGGSDIHSDLLNKIRTLKNETWQTYGMTETITHVAVRKLNPPEETEFFRALPGVKFEQDERNCLVIQASHLNESKIVTNDIVKLKNESEFEFIGRFDNIINSGGIKLSPEAIEAKLSAFVKRRFIFAGLSHKQLGQQLVLIMEGETVTSENLADVFKSANLTKYEIPKRVVTLLTFPLTESGKINRTEVIKKFHSANPFSHL